MKKTWSVSGAVLVLSLAALGAANAKNEGADQGKQKPTPEQRFAWMDTNGDGEVSLAEFTVVHEKRMERMKEKNAGKERPEGARTPPTAEAIFNRIDTNHDGALTKEELAEGHANREKDRPAGKKEKKQKKGQED